jgi:hypothetical protein
LGLCALEGEVLSIGYAQRLAEDFTMSHRVAGMLVFAGPFCVFLVLFAVNQADAGWFAGKTLGHLADPLILGCVVVSGVAGLLGFRWLWALGTGTVTVLAHFYVSYDVWVRIAGSEIANKTAFNELVWHLFFAFYGFLIGKLLFRSTKPPKIATAAGP